jgi:alanine racemase
VIEPPSLLTTRLDHIVANVRAVAAHTRTAVLVAVKANAYGHGAVEVARALAGVADALGVATVNEGVQLRRAGITTPILKLSVARGPEVALAVAHGLELVVVDEPSIAEAAAASLAAGTTTRLHLKVDTGMRRIGCEPREAVGLARFADAEAGVELVGLMSHLPISDAPEGVDFTREQVALFGRVAADVEAARGPLCKHLANSGGVLGHPESWFDMVRPGVMAYGYYPDPDVPRSIPLLPGLEWRSRVVFTKTVRAGETVSYGRTWTAPHDGRLATVPIGYGDGYSRLLSNRGRMLVGGRSYPIAGRVCMDQTMIFLGSDAAGAEVAVGDEVVLIGRSGEAEMTVDEIAALMGTIPYEVTCLVNARVAREFRG